MDTRYEHIVGDFLRVYSADLPSDFLALSSIVGVPNAANALGRWVANNICDVHGCAYHCELPYPVKDHKLVVLCAAAAFVLCNYLSDIVWSEVVEYWSDQTCL